MRQGNPEFRVRTNFLWRTDGNQGAAAFEQLKFFIFPTVNKTLEAIHRMVRRYRIIQKIKEIHEVNIGFSG